jgi:hypothetical protein
MFRDIFVFALGLFCIIRLVLGNLCNLIYTNIIKKKTNDACVTHVSAWAACMESSSGQTPSFVTVFESSWCFLRNVASRVAKGHLVWHWQPSPLFSLSFLIFTSTPPKSQRSSSIYVLLITIYFIWNNLLNCNSLLISSPSFF